MRNGCQVHSVLLPAVLSLLLMTPLDADPPTGVTVQSGRLMLAYSGHRKTIVAGINAISQPVLSPDKRHVVYVQAVPGAAISTGADDAAPNQLWLLDTGTQQKSLLVVSKTNDDMKQILAGLNSPVFSADGRQVFFLSSAWAVSEAVHAVDLKTHQVRFVCDGSSMDILRQGRYRGDLIVEKHKYRPNEGGAYDAFWLVTPLGREIKLWSMDE